MVMMPVYTRNFLSTYVQEHNVAAAHAMLRLQDLRNYAPNGYGFKVVGDIFCRFSVVSELLEVILVGSMH